MVRWRHLLLAAAMVPGVSALAGSPRGAGPAVPQHRISLETLGYHPITSAMLQREGYTMESLDFLDDTHVLLTYNARKLVRRMPEEDRETDQNRLIRALVVHLPDGKVVHETEWRTHDRNRYLWPLGQGEFVLRLRNELYFVKPLLGREGFERKVLLTPHANVDVIETSPAGDMLLVETTPEKHIGDDPTAPLQEPPVTGTFYSVEREREESPVLRKRAVLKEDRLFSTPFTSRGFLTTVKEDRQHWGFDFHPFVGKPMELGGFLSTCEPHSVFLTDATFLATGCRGGDDRRLLAGFNFSGEASWVFTTDDAPVWQALSLAPDSGRFALRTTTLNTGGFENENARLSPEEVKSQDVHVYNFRGGVDMLHVPTAPAQRPGQNFALSPNGRTLAVLHDTDLELYALPEQNAADAKELDRDRQVLKAIPMPADEVIEAKPQKVLRR